MMCRCRRNKAICYQVVLFACSGFFYACYLFSYTFLSPQLYKIFLLYNSLDFFPLLCYNVIERR